MKVECIRNCEKLLVPKLKSTRECLLHFINFWRWLLYANASIYLKKQAGIIELSNVIKDLKWNTAPVHDEISMKDVTNNNFNTRDTVLLMKYCYISLLNTTNGSINMALINMV